MAIKRYNGFAAGDFGFTELEYDAKSVNNPGYSTLTKYSGVRSLGFTPSGSDIYFQWLAGTGSHLFGLNNNSSYLYFFTRINVVTLPNVTTRLVECKMGQGATNYFPDIYITSGGVLGMSIPGTGVDIPYGTISTNVWHTIALLLDCSGTTWTVDWAVDGVAQSQTGVAGPAAELIAYMLFGMVGGASSGNVLFDGFVVGDDPTDYDPTRKYLFNRYLPNAVGTHNLDAATSAYFYKFSTPTETAITNTETNSYVYVADDTLVTSGDNLRVRPNTVTITQQYADPTADGANNAWTKSTGTAGWSLLDEAVRSPTAPSTGTDRITSTTDEQMQDIVFGNTITYSAGATYNIMIYGSSGAKRALDVQVSVDDGATWQARQTNIIGAGGAAGWYTIDISSLITNQTTLDQLRIRLICNSTAGGGGAGTTEIDAVYAVKVGSTVTTQPTSTLYIEEQFADESVLTDAPVAVRVISAVGRVDIPATTAAVTLKITDGTTTETLYTNSWAASNNSPKSYYNLLMQRPNSGGAWTLSALNNLKIQYGFTNTADGTLQLFFVMLEALFAEAGAVSYTDSGTVTSRTTPSVSENAQRVDTATIGGTTTPSFAETFVHPTVYTDSATIGSTTVLSATETAQFVDSGTITSRTTPSSTDTAQDVDSGTITSRTTPSAVDTAQFVDSGTITSTTTPSVTDTAQYVDGSTITSTTTPNGIESRTITDAATITSTTTPSSIDTAQYVDGTTITSTTTPSGTESRTITDAGTITGVTTVTGVDVATFTEAATIASSTVVSTSETAQYTDSATITSSTTPSASEAATTTEAVTITSVTTPSVVDTAQYVDQATIASATTPTLVESFGKEDSATITSTTTPSSTDVAQYIDGNTIVSTTTPTGDDSYVTPGNSGTFETTTQITYVESAQFVDSVTITSTTTPSVTEQYSRTLIDAQTVESTTTVISTDTAQYVDVANVTSLTTVSGSDTYTQASGDSATVTSTTTPSSTDTAQYVDNAQVTSRTTVSAVEIFPTQFADSAAVVGLTTITAGDVKVNVDSATVQSNTIVSGSDTYARQLSDSTTITSSTSVTTTDESAYIDSQVVVGYSTTTWDEQYFGVLADTALITSYTTFTSVEVFIFTKAFLRSSFKRYVLSVTKNEYLVTAIKVYYLRPLVHDAINAWRRWRVNGIV